MDIQAIKREARIGAIEYWIGELARMIYTLSGASIEQVEKSHAHFREHLRTMDMPIDDPAISDLSAAEIQEAHEALMTIMINAMKDRKA